MRTGHIAAALLMLAHAIAAQGTTPCSFGSDRGSGASLPNGQSVQYLSGHVVIHCPQRGITLLSDSAVLYSDRDVAIGRVHYNEPRLTLLADTVTYFAPDERVVALGHVNAKLPSGSTLVGPIAEYKRIIPTVRPRAQMTAVNRPTIAIIENDSAGKPAEPVTVVANHVFMDGDSLIYAGGQVVITRPEITAVGDSAAMDSGRETMRLMINPQIDRKRDRPFRLNGDLIDAFSSNRKLERVIARAHAKAVSQDMTLTADTIDLRVVNDHLDRAIAWGKTQRAHAVSPTQSMTADSIDVLMPGQRVREIHALRSAYAEGKPDSAKIKPALPDTMDWLRGDTILAHFDTAQSKDTTKGPVIRQLMAYRHAVSFYHLAPSDSAAPSASINYVTADTITIDFEQQKVRTVNARGNVVGDYLEATNDTTAAVQQPGNAAQSKTRAKPGAKAAPPKSVVPLPPIKP